MVISLRLKYTFEIAVKHPLIWALLLIGILYFSIIFRLFSILNDSNKHTLNFQFYVLCQLLEISVSSASTIDAVQTAIRKLDLDQYDHHQSRVTQ